MRLIDADALKEAVNTKRVLGRFNTIQLIDNAPTVKTFTLEDIEEQYRKGLEKGLSEWETERPTGEWVEERCIDIRYKIAKCSHCGKWSRLASHDTGYSVKYEYYPFCHWCGADMRGGKQ